MTYNRPQNRSETPAVPARGLPDQAAGRPSGSRPAASPSGLPSRARPLPTEDGRTGPSASVSCSSTGWAQGERRSARPVVRLRGAPGLAGQDCPGWGRGEVKLREKGLTGGLLGAAACGGPGGGGGRHGRPAGWSLAHQHLCWHPAHTRSPAGRGAPPKPLDPVRRPGFRTLSLVLLGGCPIPEWGSSLLEPLALVLRPGSSQDLAPG